MSYSKDEIEQLRNRLEALGEQDLLIAQTISQAICTMEYNLLGVYLTGEQRDFYHELWSKKLKAAKEQLESSQTPIQVFEIMSKFDHELYEFAKAEKVNSADKAMEIAHSFVKKYVAAALPMKAAREGDVWLVDVDVGAFAVKVAKVEVDARTGDILGYEIPPK
jgi:uncharacterized membrane protein YkoI